MDGNFRRKKINIMLEIKKIYLTVIIPCFNEEDNVVLLHSEILQVCEKINKPCEIIFIDDGSTDETFKKL